MKFETVRKVNQWFRSADKAEVSELLSKIILSDQQIKIFEMFYLKRQCINYIADSLIVCPQVISKELKEIREKIYKIIIKEL